MKLMQGMGPILYFRSTRGDVWSLSALVARPAELPSEPLLVGGREVAAERLDQRLGLSLWRYDFALPLGDAARRHEYRIGERAWTVQVPAVPGGLRLAFTACNGSEAGNAWKKPEARNPLWRDLAAKHATNPFHLLLQGGDQLYADPIWRDVPQLARWRRLPARRRFQAPFTPDMEEAVRNYYFEQYCKIWAQPDLAPILASVPSLMMWDDHDIIDGWGSYPQKWHDCAVMQGIWSAAREHFALFQLAARPDDLPEGFGDRSGRHYGWSHRIGELGILAPDLRSERSRSQVMGEAGRRAFTAALESLAGCRHVLLVSTVPLVNARLHTIERLFRWIPGHQSLQDDLVDQWPSVVHWEEWSRLLRELTGFSARNGATVTSLSGEIHLGALGLIESPGARIHQLTSSGIVHPPPSALLAMVFDLASRAEIRLEPDISVNALPMPDLGKRYLRKRNWLELDVAPVGGLAATWHDEGGKARRFDIGPSEG